MSDIVAITTHEDDAVARLIGQYQGKPRMEALVRLLAKQVQKVEDALVAIYVQSAIDSAVGAQLDQVGDIVGEKRAGKLDDDYRRFLRARIKVNYSDGKLSQLLAIALLILGDVPIKAWEHYPSSLVMQSDDVPVDAYILWRDFLHKAAGAAKRLTFVYSKRPADSTMKRGSFYGGLSLSSSQRPGSVWTTGIGGGKTAGAFA